VIAFSENPGNKVAPPEMTGDHETNFVWLFIWQRKEKRKTKRD
jgi:hypothetical protein